ncbi:MAG: hypothetical protein K2N51_20815 [Lachnospiraceae bacterium]|nr:hypothetical protein [Lachnospiraceae bacterium]
MRCKIGIPKDEMSIEELERYQKAVELYEYRKNRASTQFTTEYIFHFIKEWEEARMKIKRAGGW